MASTYLLAFHIGPVQDFITTARRTQDLWISSWLLSHLSRTAIQFAKLQNAEVVLPNIPAIENTADADTPNYFFARLESENSAGIARGIETAVRERWREIAATVKDKFFDPVDAELWKRQVENFLEIYWVLVPDGDNETARNRARTALIARKRVRDFSQTKESHLKCSLCGVRQEVSGGTFLNEAKKWWANFKECHKGVRIREDGTERLCAICAIKRTALVAGAFKDDGLNKEDGNFPSTSNVAAATFKKLLLKTGKGQMELTKHFKELEDLGVTNQIKNDCLSGLCKIEAEDIADGIHFPKTLTDKLLTFDGDVFYLETFTEKRLKEEYTTPQAEYAEYGTASLRAVFRAVDARPSKYFAVLKMDGDRMGAFFEQASDEQAQALSGRLSQFARKKAKETIEGHCGRLVYAGGDDGLALLPLETALLCARELQEGFKEAVKEIDLPEGVERPTPSTGIAIAHHTAPLDGILLAMQRAEKSAKNTYGRDALCVHILKRSGEEVRIGTHWTTREGHSLVWLVEQAVEYLRGEVDVLSMKFPYTVAAEARGLTELPLEARQAELKRLTKRHKGNNFDELKAAAFAEKLASWADVLHGDKDHLKPLGLEEVAQWLLFARFIATGGRDEE